MFSVVLRQLDIYMQKYKVGPLLHTIHKKIYSKWITDQSVKTTGIKFFEKTQKYLQDHGLSNDFLDMTAKTSNKKK